MKRLAILLALLAAAPALGQNTQPVPRSDPGDVGFTACGGTTPATCAIPNGGTQFVAAGQADLMVMLCAGDDKVSPTDTGVNGWAEIGTATQANVTISAWYKIATAADADGSCEKCVVAFENGGNYEQCAIVPVMYDTYNALNPVSSVGSGSNGTISGLFPASGTAVNGGSVTAGKEPGLIFLAIGGSQGSGNPIIIGGHGLSTGYQTANIASSNWTEAANFSTALGNDGGLAVAVASSFVSSGNWGGVQFNLNYSTSLAWVSFGINGNAPVTPSPTPSDTPTATFTATRTATPTVTNTFPTFTATATGTRTATPTDTQTPADTGTVTPTRTETRTGTATRTATPMNTGTITQTPTATATQTRTYTRTATATVTPDPAPIALVDDNSGASVQSGWTFPEDDGFIMCFKRHPNLSGAAYCLGVGSPYRFFRDALNQLVGGNPAPDTLAIDATMTTTLSGRTVRFGRSSEDHPMLVAAQLTDLVCLREQDCEVTGGRNYTGLLGPQRNGLPMPVTHDITVRLDATLTASFQYFTITGDPAAFLGSAQTKAMQGCLPKSVSLTTYTDTGTALLLTALPASCNAEVGFVVNGAPNSVLCSVATGASEDDCDIGDIAYGYLPDDLRGLYVHGESGCAGAERIFIAEVACAASEFD